MGKRAAAEEADLGAVVSNAVHHLGKLLGQHAELLRAEMRQELRQAGDSVLSMAAGGGVAAAGGLLSGLALAHLLHRVTGLPLWSCYGTAAAACCAGGVALVRAGQKGLADIHLVPPQTAAALKEDVAWLKEQLQPLAE